tara:strand:+ start:864 stop:1172 length:309 start_codon:yes stop_codon:yes gene_type:complete
MELNITDLSASNREPKDVLNWFVELSENGLLWHLDDDPRDCLSLHDITEEQMRTIISNQSLVFSISEEKHFCPFAMLVDVSSSDNHGKELSVERYIPSRFIN